MNWFLMGGYAWFVWPSYAIGILILLWGAVVPYYRHKRIVKEFRRELERLPNSR